MRHFAVIAFLIASTNLHALQLAANYYDKEVDAIIARDAANPPPKQSIVFIGSSTFTRWATLQEDLKPLPVFNHAFGGARAKDLLRAMPKLVLPTHPKVIVYYCGARDIETATSDPQLVVKGFKNFVTAVQAKLPDAQIVHVAINPNLPKWALWKLIQEANTSIKTYCETDKKLTYLDVSSVLLGADGKPKAELYIEDGHLNAQGYAAIIPPLKKAVTAAWLAAGGTVAAEAGKAK
ncbi:MAG: GDSL-type esterase/lipase family protein [Planctomycetota bacterium]